MDWLRYAAIASLLAVATVAGGTAVRLGIAAAGDPRAAATLGLVAVFLAVAIATGARGRRWRHNPYW